MPDALLYLHGFNSSPASFKALALQNYMQDAGLGSRLRIPYIKTSPAEAYMQLSAEFASLQQGFDAVAVAGSSLGGFYATMLAEQHDCRAVLINPAVRPHVLLEKYIGENVNYHTEEHWRFDASYIEQLQQLDVETITSPERYLVLLQTGDETLDYRDALEKYAGCEIILEQGGNHAFTGFEKHIPRLLAFCGIK